MDGQQKQSQGDLPPCEDLPSGMESDASNGTPRKRFGHTTDKPNTSGNHSAAVKPEGKDAASPSGVSVTVLTLDASATSASRQRNKNGASFSQTQWTADGDFSMPELKYVRDFQVRRKYGRRSTTFQSPRREQTLVELGLLGTKYFNGVSSATPHDNNNNNDNNNNDNNNKDNNNNGYSSSNNDTTNYNAPTMNNPRFTKRNTTSSLLDESKSFFLNGGLSVTPSIAAEHVTPLGKSAEDRGSADSVLKDLNSPLTTSFPPLTPSPRAGARSENSFYSSRLPGQTSLLMNDYGFNTIRTDTFSGLKRQRRLKSIAASENDDLFRELEQHAQKQILACQNMGYFHRGSRAAENVLSLKETVSPNAFHPPAFFTRHVSREERLTSRDGASRGGEDERRSFRRLTHPGPAGKLSVPRLMLQDRQDQAARRTLPSVSGSSLQVMLAHTHAK